jgi:capsular exopolysaccharide synthesis family protein
VNKLITPEGDANRDRALELLAQRLELRRMDDLGAERIRGLGEDDSDFDVRRYLSMLLRRKWTILGVVVLAAVVALVQTFRTMPIYRSSLLLQIEPQDDQFLQYQQEMSLGASNWSWNFYQTQYELLRSSSLARRVIDQLGLEASATVAAAPAEGDAAQAKGGGSFFAELKSSIRNLFVGDGGSSTEDTLSTSSESKKPNLEGALLARLTVAPVPDSRLVRIYYDSPNPREAAAVANAVADNFVNMTLERRYNASGYAKKFLEERIQQVRANLEDSERRLVDYARERGIVDFDDRLGSLRQTFNALNSALVQAQTERIEFESVYAQSQKGGPSSLRVLENEAIQALKARKGELELAYQDNLKVYKPGYSKMRQLRGQIAELDEQIQNEIAAVAQTVDAAARADYAAKVDEEAKLQARVREVKSEILDLQNRSTDYQALKREVVTNRELYDGLLQRMKEVGVVAGLTTNNISIVDRAKVPTAPYKPNLRANISRALMIGLMIGILLAFLLEYLDDTVKTSQDVESRGRMPVLGTIPLASGKEHGIREDEISLLAATNPKSPLAEAVRSLRTALVFSTTEGAPTVLHVTSAGPGEGKTTAATNVAIAFAQAGSKVLLIDADLRSPSLHRVFSLTNDLGLTNYLAGDTPPADIAQPTEVVRLFTITSGPLPPNPVELMSSAKMLDLLSVAAERFDFVVIDGPPIIGLADAVVLASLANGTMFVVEAGGTRYGALEGAVKRLRGANATLVGAVLTKFGRRGKGYGYGYSYDYHYTYSYGVGDRSRLPENA